MDMGVPKMENGFDVSKMAPNIRVEILFDLIIPS
jgi:hypothetical protein